MWWMTWSVTFFGQTLPSFLNPPERKCKKRKIRAFVMNFTYFSHVYLPLKSPWDVWHIMPAFAALKSCPKTCHQLVRSKAKPYLPESLSQFANDLFMAKSELPHLEERKTAFRFWHLAKTNGLAIIGYDPCPIFGRTPLVSCRELGQNLGH